MYLLTLYTQSLPPYTSKTHQWTSSENKHVMLCGLWNQLKFKLLVQYKVKRQIDRLPLFSSRFLFSSWFLPSTLWVVPKYPLCDTTYPLRSTKFSRGTNHVRSVFSSLVTILICTSTNLSKLVLLLHNTAPDEVPPLPQVLSPGFGIWFLGNSIWSILLSHT